MIHRLREMFGMVPPLVGLEDILAKVAGGQITEEEAARDIRRLAARPYIPPWALRSFRYLGLLFAAIGICFGIYSLLFAIGCAEAPGTVVRVVGGRPVVEYPVRGKPFTIQGAVSSSPPAYTVGERVSVLYRPRNPSVARINTFTECWLFPLAFTAFGTVFFVVATFAPRVMGMEEGPQEAVRRDVVDFGKAM